jgi:hypothetical protein
MNRQPYQFPLTAGLTPTQIFNVQETAGGLVEKATIQILIDYLATFGIGGSMLFQLMSDLKATTVLAHKSILYNTIGDSTIPEDAGQWYFDNTRVDADNGRSILIPDVIIFPAPGRFIQRT